MEARVKPDHLTTTSEDGKRIKIFPSKRPSNGYFEKKRKVLHFFLIFIYLSIPWINIKGHPLLLLDVVNRRFSIFGTLFFAHEAPDLIFVALIFLFTMALMSSVLGRAWCGWMCPQTIFIERFYRKVEQWIEGDRPAQMKLDQAQWDFEKVSKRGIKWFLYICLSLILSHSFLAYFVGAKASYLYMTQSPADHWGAFIATWIFAGIVLFDFAFFREQFCLIACPYGRFQAVLMDQKTMVVNFDANRKDCIDCRKCVNVCPVGIDIRQGLQIECLACTACIDACNSVMTKLQLKKNLIGYTPFTFRSPRAMIYTALLGCAIVGLGYKVSIRNPFQMEVERAIDAPYQVVDDGKSKWIINHFKVKFHNLGWDSRSVKLELPASAKELGVELIEVGRDANIPLDTLSGTHSEVQIFLKVPASALAGFKHPRVTLQSTSNGELFEQEVKLIGPAS